MDIHTQHLSVTPRPTPALGADLPSVEPSHIHIPRPSRLQREHAANPDVTSELTGQDEPEPPLACAA